MLVCIADVENQKCRRIHLVNGNKKKKKKKLTAVFSFDNTNTKFPRPAFLLVQFESFESLLLISFHLSWLLSNKWNHRFSNSFLFIPPDLVSSFVNLIIIPHAPSALLLFIMHLTGTTRCFFCRLSDFLHLLLSDSDEETLEALIPLSPLSSITPLPCPPSSTLTCLIPHPSFHHRTSLCPRDSLPLISTHLLSSHPQSSFSSTFVSTSDPLSISHQRFSSDLPTLSLP